MPTSHATDMFWTKHAVFFVAALITLMAIRAQTADASPAKVRFDDSRPRGTLAQQRADGRASAETASTRTSIVFPLYLGQNDPVMPGHTGPVATATGSPVRERYYDGREWISWVLVLLVIVAVIVIWRILRHGRTQHTSGQRDNGYKPPVYPLRIAIKFKTGAGQPPQELDGWQVSVGASKRMAPLRVIPLFESLDSYSLDELVDRALKNNSAYKPPDLSAWFQVVTPLGLNAHELVKPLRKFVEIETAYVMRPVPPPMSAADNPLNVLQGYENAAPDGIDARYAWGFIGGTGAGIGFVDLEEAWNLNHQDLKNAKITIISGENSGDHSHGTAVLGQVLMVDNTKGGLGIAPSATGRVISQWRNRSSYNTADAIAHAAANMLFGDVLLLEAQEYKPNGREGDETLWPVEIADASYDAIILATAAGIVVVEAGANGKQNLDAYKNASGQKIFDRNSPDFRDSGAIMVGAGSSDPSHRRLGFSNYGSRIDCYAWGENIETTSTNVAGKTNTMYTAVIKGTSGASPMIAGAALILQGLRQAALDRGVAGKRFSAREMRDLLTGNGTPSKTPATDKIGVMPDLRAIITHNLMKLIPVPITNSAP